MRGGHEESGAVGRCCLQRLGNTGCAAVLNRTMVACAAKTRLVGAPERSTAGQEFGTASKFEMKRKVGQRFDCFTGSNNLTDMLMQSELGGSSFGNLLLGRSIGTVVDSSKRGSIRCCPRPQNARLAEKDTSKEEGPISAERIGISKFEEHDDSVQIDGVKKINVKIFGLTGSEAQ